MLVSFTVENVYSFYDAQTLNARAVATCKERREEATFAPFAGRKGRLVKTLAVYGANASGKSNIFYALAGMRENVLHSASEATARAPLRGIPFLFSADGPVRPSSCTLEFIVGDAQYKYGYSIMGERVVGEFLLRKSARGKRYDELFSRTTRGTEDLVSVAPAFGADELVISKRRTNALLLSTCAMLSVPEAMKVADYFAWRINVVAAARLSPNHTARQIADGRHRDEIIRFLRMTDPGIGGVEVTASDRETGRLLADGTKEHAVVYEPQVRPMLKEGGVSERALPMDMIASLGTIKAFSLASYVFEALDAGTVLVLDELDSRLHPLLTREIIRLFNQTETNPKNAQLVFNTHDTNLLGVRTYNPTTKKREYMLRRDEIYFVEKNGEMCSKIYSLIDFRKEGKSVRNDASYEKDYLEGLYGAIPYLGWK